MNNIKNITYAFLVLCLSFHIFPIQESYSETIEKEVSDISNELMCPVCRGQTVAESNSSLANDFREIIRKKLEAGESKQEILNYFIDRYGESVLASPPAKGIRLIVWVTPLLVIIIGFFILTKFIKSKNIKAEKEEHINGTEDSYLKNVDNEIDKLNL